MNQKKFWKRQKLGDIRFLSKDDSDDLVEDTKCQNESNLLWTYSEKAVRARKWMQVV